MVAAAGQPALVMFVALDYAKREHRVLIVNGAGDVLSPAFSAHNSADGVAFLRDKVAACMKRNRIAPINVCYGGEDEPAWANNFLNALISTGALVMRVNARDAKDLRESNVASTDDLDLLGIAKCLITRKARPIRALAMQTDDQAVHCSSLRELMRQRRRLVFTATSTKNQAQSFVDRLCPGFLDETKSGLSPFGTASLELMKDRFSANELARRKPESLAGLLQRCGIGAEEAAQKVTQIQALATTTLAPDLRQVPALQRSLRSSIHLLMSLRQVIDDLEAAMADELSCLPAAVFTTLPGISIVLASGLAAELGPRLHEQSFSSQCAYAGIVPRTAQSGGSGSAPVQGAPSRRSNSILKDYLVQAASKQQTCGTPEFKDAFNQLKADGRHAEFSIARKMLRTLRAMHQQQSIYMPPALRPIAALEREGRERTEAETQSLRAWYHQVFKRQCVKWAHGPEWQRMLGEDRVLGIHLRTMDNLLGLGFKWPQSRAKKAPATTTSAAAPPATLDESPAPDRPEEQAIKKPRKTLTPPKSNAKPGQRAKDRSKASPGGDTEAQSPAPLRAHGQGRSI
jgi:transposase